MNIRQKQMLGITTLGATAFAGFLTLTGPLQSQSGNHAVRGHYLLPAPIACRVSYKASESAGWQSKTLSLNAQRAETVPLHEEKAIFPDMAVHCSYTASPYYTPNVFVEVIDTHTGKQISSTEYDFDRDTLKNQFHSQGFSGFWYVSHPTKHSLIQVTCAVP